jgi:hypothetical protein
MGKMFDNLISMSLDLNNINNIVQGDNADSYIDYARMPIDLAKYDYPKEKKFICKGRHQYREVRETKNNVTKSYWICQCSRILE